MTTLFHQVSIHAPAARLFSKITTNIGGWWDKPNIVKTGESVTLEFHPGSEHGVLKMRVLEALADRRVEWECISTHPRSSPASAWTGTHIIFDIEERGEGSVLDFRHTGWDEASEYIGFCNYAWAMALQKLKQACEQSELRAAR
jgi:hypothetical protein